MTKQIIKVYLEEDDVKSLQRKATDSGFIGKGAISHYIEKVAKEPIVFLDNNLKSALKMFALK